MIQFARIARFQFFSFIIVLISCNEARKVREEEDNLDEMDRYNPKPYVQLKHPDWSKNATIYEVNIRQYTPEGTFKAFESHLPRLKAMGVDIIWLMPIHPIGELKRKGTLGSYYSVKDYYSVNPEFGTRDDFDKLVEKIHEIGMYVIIDWVANHSSWDNVLVEEHPQYYSKTLEGSFQPTPWYDWDDVIDFDFDQPGLRAYMTDAMKFWVREANIDGYRCDAAGFLPVDFWENARKELDQIKPVFMLAEWESRDLHQRAFDMTYAWSLWDKMHKAAVGKEGIGSLVEYLAHDVNTFPRGAYRMTFTDNHDKNSWEGTQYSNFGGGLEAAIILTCTVNGMPMVYSGQEAGLDRSLAFFEKDSIVWKDHPNYELFRKLFELKHSNQALWNGEWGGEMRRINSNQMDKVISFEREKNGDRVIAIVNFSNEKVNAKLDSENHSGSFIELFTGQEYILTGTDSVTLDPWGYMVLIGNDDVDDGE